MARPPTTSPSRASEDLVGITEQGAAPETRLSSPRAAHSLFTKFLEADRASAHNRRLLQDVVDGAAPYNDSILRTTGQGWRFNLNFLEGDTQMQASLTALNDLIESVETMARVKLPYSFLTPDERLELEDVISEELDTMIREWPEFDAHWQMLTTQFLGMGVGFAPHPDEETWKWVPGGWDDYLMPRQTKATEEAVECLIGKKAYPVHELYKKIKSPEHASGWDVQETRKAIVAACKGKKKEWERYWPSIEKELKNNDLSTSYAVATEVQAQHLWIREFDGTYSFFITLEDGSNENFLYKQIGKFKSATDAFTIFACGVGNGTYHSIRGLLWKMFPYIQTSNRLRCGMLDSTLLAMTLLMQPIDEDSVDDMIFTVSGPVAYLPPGAQVVERGLPNVAVNALPVVQDLSANFVQATGQFRPVSGAGAGREQTAEEFRGNQEMQATLTTSTINMFYRSWRRLFSSMFKRIQAIGPKNTRFPEVAAFYKRCEDRGVTADVVQKVEKVSIVKAIGNGSPQMRMQHFRELTEMLGRLDEVGRANVTRDQIANRFGRDTADRYAPKVARVAPEVKIAALENIALKTGEIPVLPGETHAVHLSVHFPALIELAEQLDAVLQEEGTDVRPLRAEIEQAMRIHSHAGEHLNALAVDETRAEQVKEMTRGLQQVTGILNSIVRQLQAQEEESAEQEMQQGQGMSPETMQKLQEKQMIADQKLANDQRKFEQNKEQKDIITDIKLRDMIRTQTVKQLPTLNRN